MLRGVGGPAIINTAGYFMGEMWDREVDTKIETPRTPESHQDGDTHVL